MFLNLMDRKYGNSLAGGGQLENIIANQIYARFH